MPKHYHANGGTDPYAELFRGWSTVSVVSPSFPEDKHGLDLATSRTNVEIPQKDFRALLENETAFALLPTIITLKQGEFVALEKAIRNLHSISDASSSSPSSEVVVRWFPVSAFADKKKQQQQQRQSGPTKHEPSETLRYPRSTFIQCLLQFYISTLASWKASPTFDAFASYSPFSLWPFFALLRLSVAPQYDPSQRSSSIVNGNSGGGGGGGGAHAKGYDAHLMLSILYRLRGSLAPVPFMSSSSSASSIDRIGIGDPGPAEFSRYLSAKELALARCLHFHSAATLVDRCVSVRFRRAMAENYMAPCVHRTRYPDWAEYHAAGVNSHSLQRYADFYCRRGEQTVGIRKRGDAELTNNEVKYRFDRKMELSFAECIDLATNALRASSSLRSLYSPEAWATYSTRVSAVVTTPEALFSELSRTVQFQEIERLTGLLQHIHHHESTTVLRIHDTRVGLAQTIASLNENITAIASLSGCGAHLKSVRFGVFTCEQELFIVCSQATLRAISIYGELTWRIERRKKYHTSLDAHEYHLFHAISDAACDPFPKDTPKDGDPRVLGWARPGILRACALACDKLMKMSIEEHKVSPDRSSQWKANVNHQMQTSDKWENPTPSFLCRSEAVRRQDYAKTEHALFCRPGPQTWCAHTEYEKAVKPVIERRMTATRRIPSFAAFDGDGRTHCNSLVLGVSCEYDLSAQRDHVLLYSSATVMSSMFCNPRLVLDWMIRWDDDAHRVQYPYHYPYGEFDMVSAIAPTVMARDVEETIAAFEHSDSTGSDVHHPS